ncbi:Uma2 family endonuclease [Argonema antarcticum]|uniref:Uma2 family endonuclease n=1 Tax=Argonema antarcticum TaxID=2942763 RepID=UPI002011B903|nr:Uma2 family endonuclease [Argonema antarcticum]MCL1472868.1 Uma2 family endonuclease [Argonema antarcticum A004/B2]
MVATQDHPVPKMATLTVTWEKLPDDFQLEEKPVENTGQPLIAGALREILELMGYIKPEMLIASNFGLCATVNGDLVIKAPDWVYVPSVLPLEPAGDRKSYTPQLEGEIPSVVMEFLSETDGGEYSVKRTYPPGKWFFYEHILQVPAYVIFDPDSGLLEVYRLKAGRYELELPDPEGRHWMADMGLFLGVWRGEKEERTGYWLRWWDEGGNLLLWGVERLEQERQRAEQERQRAEQERQRADRLAQYLRSQGINPDEISQ